MGKRFEQKLVPIEKQTSSQGEISSQSELMRLSRTNFSEAYQILTHLKVVRVFVESVLRYGLPTEYSAIVVKVSRTFGTQMSSGPLNPETPPPLSQIPRPLSRHSRPSPQIDSSPHSTRPNVQEITRSRVGMTILAGSGGRSWSRSIIHLYCSSCQSLLLRCQKRLCR